MGQDELELLLRLDAEDTIIYEEEQTTRQYKITDEELTTGQVIIAA